MPTKKKDSKTTSKKKTSAKKSASPKKSAVKKTVVKKKPTKKTATKKTVVKKTSVKKTPAKKKSSVKKSSVKKKPTTKKTTPTKTSSSVKKEVEMMRKEVAEAVSQAPIVSMDEERIEHTHKPTEVHRRVVFVGTCSNCDHVPLRLNKLLALFSVIIFVLSSIVLLNGSGLKLPSIEFAGDTAPIEIRFQRLN
jgi:hypothetical protein